MARFEIDEEKLASIMPPPTSSAWEDLKWSGAFFGLIAFWVALIVGIIALLLSLL